MRPRVFASANVYLAIAVTVVRLYAVASAFFCGLPGYESIDELQKTWLPGQKIICALPNIAGVVGFHHYMLVLDKTTLVHTVSDNNGVYHVTKRHYKNIGERVIKRGFCRNQGYGLYKEKAVERARDWDPEQAIYFNVLKCNCKHWVQFWADGIDRPSCPAYYIA